MQNDTGPLGAIVIFFVLAALYFLPSINARSRKHPNLGSIFLLNLLLGWTLIGWVVAIVWSASAISPVEPIRVKPAETSDRLEKLEKLGSLKERGLLTESEYETEKSKLLSS